MLFNSCQNEDPSISSYTSPKMYEKFQYSEVAQKTFKKHIGPVRNPVILVHGFLGSKLENIRTKEIVWGEMTSRMILRGYSDDYLRQLSLPMGKGKSLAQLTDNIRPISVLDSFNVVLWSINFQISGYNKMIEILSRTGYVLNNDFAVEDIKSAEDIPSMFTFYYDWRRSLPENAARLHDFVLEKRKKIQMLYQKYYRVKDFDLQFDILAHSMGGLVSRYYLRYGDQQLPADGSLPKFDWRGSKYIDTLVIIGTPNSGYLDTFRELVEGLKLDERAPIYPRATIGTFHSYYQMLPLTSTRSVVYDDAGGENIDMYDVNNWILNGWGLADPEIDSELQILLPNIKTVGERRAIAIDHLTKCLKKAEQFNRAMRIYKKAPIDVRLILFAGDAVDTPRQAIIDRGTGKIIKTNYDAGDGKVLATSAVMDERDGRDWAAFAHTPIDWDVIIFLKAAHMGITESYSFADNVTFYLLSMPSEKDKQRLNYYRKYYDKNIRDKGYEHSIID
ncbi:hypothetical protein AAEX28_11640 [Lentisphaerota bacterium WC36G]|nr:hypothetical protein LJT99_14475 [Lentisphaerae bacterium WC36]